jgi:hypothetical protein
MKQLKYNASDNEMRVDFPEEWNAQDLTGLDIEMKDTTGEVVLASTAATIPTSTTLEESVDRYTDVITLAAGAQEPDKGDSLLIVGAGGQRVVRAKGYDPTTRIVTLEEIVEIEFDAGDSVHYLWATYDLDTTDTDAFAVGLHIQAIWTPSGAGQATKELYEVSKYVMDLVNLRARFQRLYPRAYRAYTEPTDRFADMRLEAEEEVIVEMAGARMDYNKIVGQSIAVQVVMAKMAYMWTFNGDDEIEDEREFLKERYNTKFAEIKNLPIWQDTDQDDVKDDGEVQDHQPFFERNW